MQTRFSLSGTGLIVAVLFSLLTSLPAAAVELPELLQQAQALLRDDDADQALEVLAAEELQYAGNADYDYWLGLTAVRAHQPARAIFALERVLETDPNHAGARLELATAYVQLKQRDAARRELDKLAQLDPPPAAADRIADLNKAVDRQDTAEQRKNRVIYLTLEAGHDDNVGTWPDTRFDVLPGSPAILPVDSAFYAVQGGLWQRFNLSGTQKLDVSLTGVTRANQQDDAEQFDQDYLGGKVEWARDRDGAREVALGLDVAGMNLDGEEYYRFYGIYNEWRNRLSSTQNWRTRFSTRMVDFDLDLYDYQQSRVTTGMTWIVGGNLRVDASLNADYEAADDDRPGGDAVVYGVRAGVLKPVGRSQRVGINGSYQIADYRRTVPAFAAFNATPEDRDDDRLTAAVNWDWLPTQSIQVRAKAEYRQQDSSLETYEFDQTIGSLALSYYF